MRLLQRTTRALHLTEEGEVFYAAAQRIVGEIETLENQITGHSGTPQGLLRVTTSLAFAPTSSRRCCRSSWRAIRWCSSTCCRPIA